MSFAHSYLTEGEFLGLVVERSGCGLLLDVNNAYVNAANLGLKLDDFFAALPLGAVQEIHLAGHSRRRIGVLELLLDDHGSAVCEAVWALYESVLQRLGPVPTLIEWDNDVPALDTLPADGSPDYVERFDAYRNNARQFFATALEQTFPVVLRRVGTQYFRQLAREYRDVHPSRRGDLHWVGSEFPSWLSHRMAESGYEWLADLAALEWAVANATVSPTPPAIPITALAEFAPESLADLRVELQPSLQMVASQFPVWHVWQANQRDDPGPVDLALGGECCVVACVDDRPVVYCIDKNEYRLLERLARGDTLSDALAAAEADAVALGRVLAWAFGERLVAGIVSPSAPASR